MMSNARNARGNLDIIGTEGNVYKAYTGPCMWLVTGPCSMWFASIIVLLVSYHIVVPTSLRDTSMSALRGFGKNR